MDCWQKKEKDKGLKATYCNKTKAILKYPHCKCIEVKWHMKEDQAEIKLQKMMLNCESAKSYYKKMG